MTKTNNPPLPERDAPATPATHRRNQNEDGNFQPEKTFELSTRWLEMFLLWSFA